MKSKKTCSPFLPYVPGRPTVSDYAHLQIVRHRDLGPVQLRNEPSGLFIGDRPVALLSHDRQRPAHGEHIATGRIIETLFRKKALCGAEVIDAFVLQPHCFPEVWKEPIGPNQYPMYFTLGTIYGAHGPRREKRVGKLAMFARGVYWNGTTVREIVHSLDLPWYEDIRILALA